VEIKYYAPLSLLSPHFSRALYADIRAYIKEGRVLTIKLEVIAGLKALEKTRSHAEPLRSRRTTFSPSRTEPDRPAQSLCASA
jgi:hypothetical protein